MRHALACGAPTNKISTQQAAGPQQSGRAPSARLSALCDPPASASLAHSVYLPPLAGRASVTVPLRGDSPCLLLGREVCPGPQACKGWAGMAALTITTRFGTLWDSQQPYYAYHTIMLYYCRAPQQPHPAGNTLPRGAAACPGPNNARPLLPACPASGLPWRLQKRHACRLPFSTIVARLFFPVI